MSRLTIALLAVLLAGCDTIETRMDCEATCVQCENVRLKCGGQRDQKEAKYPTR